MKRKKEDSNPEKLSAEAIIEQYASPCLDRADLYTLRSTCRFFYTRESLQTLINTNGICAGESHSLIFTHNKLLVCGHNGYGQLGLGHSKYQNSFVNALQGVLRTGEIVLQVAAGSQHSLVLTSQQRLLVSGDNFSGQLGLGDSKNRNSFIDALSKVLSAEETILQIAAGSQHSLVLTSKQRLLVCGSNLHGQLGLGHTVDQHSFSDALAGVLPKDETVLQIAAGYNHTLILTSKQRLLVCGDNHAGQLGPDCLKNQDSFIDALTEVLRKGETVLQIAAGGNHTLLLTSQQRLLVCGTNLLDQLGHIGNQQYFVDVLASVLQKGESVLQVVAGSNHILVLTNQQRLLVCGHNSWGQLGIGQTDKQKGFSDALAGVLSAGETVLRMAAGGWHTLVLTSKDRLLTCGYNCNGELGLGHTENQLRLVSNPLFGKSALNTKSLLTPPPMEDQSSEEQLNCCVQ